jgi:hypothetical protein
MNLFIAEGPRCAISGSIALFDHLVGAGERHGRHVEAERLGRLEVDREFVLGRRLPVFKRKKTGGVAARARQALDEPGADRIGDNHEHDRHADPPHPLALLRPRHQRPRRRAAEHSDELSSSHEAPSLGIGKMGA